MHHRLIGCAVQDLQDFEAGAGICQTGRDDRRKEYDVVFHHVDFDSHGVCSPQRRNGRFGCAWKTLEAFTKLSVTYFQL